jgi:hypothetical protein
MRLEANFEQLIPGEDLVGLFYTSLFSGASAVIQQLIRLLKLLLGLHSALRRQVVECM